MRARHRSDTPTSARAHGASGDAKTAYRRQLDELSEAYRRIREHDASAFAELVHAVRRRQALYVGSGGALAVAQLAADLHEAQGHSLARAATPLELMGAASVHEAAVMIFTASGRHPDASAAVAAASRAHAEPLVVVTQRPRAQLPPDFAREAVKLLTLPAPVKKEGFLATGSVLTMSAALLAASGLRLPPRLPHLEGDGIQPLRRNTLVLGGPGLSAVATDLETRLSETGLSAVQVTDYRNFAHGRHTGFSRHLDQTTVVALISPELRELAEATLASLPANADVVRLESRLEWPLCVLDLLIASMKLVAVTAEQTDFDPSRPGVPPFGRRLYHLSSQRYVPAAQGPVDRKLAAARLPRAGAARTAYERAFEQWSSRIRDTIFGGVVLDYDGTVCTTEGRFELPDVRVRERVLELLDAGAIIGFASGRGSSLHRDLRAWVPPEFCARVELGLYNGGSTSTLDQEFERADGSNEAVADAAKRIKSAPLGRLVEIEQRSQQLAVQPRSSRLASEALAQLVTEIVARPPALPLKIVASAHSVDVVPTDSVKTQTLERVQQRAGSEVLAIGDQGQVGGNDFELLSATTWSLSVDQVSGDPSRCWNLDERGERGPALLCRYLEALRPTRRGIVFRWK